ncbi:MAG: NosD domain-containing protein [Candidatus Lokiarchaeota archaeon]
MKTQRKTILLGLILFLMILPIITQISINYSKNTQISTNTEPVNIKSAGFWGNFTFIHITNLNWTIANETEWCSGSGTYIDPYTIKNMIINATDSPIGCGILIQNSIDEYFKIENVTIFGTSNGIKLESTNNGALVDNILLDNLDSGIDMINSANNTLSENTVMNNGLCGINLTSYCFNNKILGNTVKNQGTNLQDTGINLRIYCNNNDILGNRIYDNNVYGINIENDCQENVISNNTITNLATNQQDYGIRLHSDCDQNTITLNIIEDLNSNGIYMVTSDQNSVSDNQIIECGSGMYMLIDYQSIITGNTISGGSYGIIMSACDGGEFAHNFINETVNYAIRIYINSDNNEFYENFIKDNDNIGIQLDDPSDTNNDFYKNSFISNGIHAYDNGTATSWDDSAIGNYWDDYIGEDLNYDNRGDTPYNISGAANAKDNLPIYDHWSPIFIINAPSSSSYGSNAPEFNLLVNETYVYSMWYTINNNAKKYYFTGNGTVAQNAWNELNEGYISLKFYCRDIAWNVYYDSVSIIKDTSNPIISIISPTYDELFGKLAPNFVIEISDFWSPIDSMWYTFNNGVTKYYFTENATIDQNAWNAINDGIVNITFYGQDTAFNTDLDNVSIIKELSPLSGNYFNTTAPDFTVEINDLVSMITSMWYTINNGGTKYYFTENGTIDQNAWNAIDNGIVNITFYGQDTALNVNYKSVTIIKDTGDPIISIISPIDAEKFGMVSPNFVIEVSDLWSPIDKMWYTINNSGTKYYFTENSTINQDAWLALNDNGLIITFYVRDIAWNIGFSSISLIKDTTVNPGNELPPFDIVIFIILISAIAIVAASLAVILVRRLNKTSDLPKKSKFLNKEQLAEAQYFKDVTSILIILAIHKESGLALSKIALHGGIGLDENLFTGFISAMGSFKDELAKQMGLHVRDEGGDNVIEYNEFTITILDGEFLRLGLVSYSSLGTTIKQQCGEVLRAYEVKHMDRLKDFDGEILVFKDFGETIESGLDMNLNKKCIINIKQLNKFDAPEQLKMVLQDFKLKSKEFYPLELSRTLLQKNNIPELEANYMVYNAYKHGVFIPAN